MAMVDKVYWLPIGGFVTQACWSKDRRPPCTVSVFIAWTEWILEVALL